MRKVFIYGLVDPRSQMIRYVGKANNVWQRLARHLEPRQLADGSHRANWLRSLVNQGLVPDVVILEEVDEDQWQERERAWIAHYRDAGFDLTNGTDGGDGVHNPSVWARLRNGLARRGRQMAEEQRTKISARLRGRSFTDEHRSNLSKAATGRQLGGAVRALLSERHRGHKRKARYYLVTWPDGVTDPVYDMQAYCREKGLSAPRMSQLLNGKVASYRGMAVEEITQAEYERWTTIRRENNDADA